MARKGTRKPVVELRERDAQPQHERANGDLRPLVPTADVVDHFVAGVVGNPTSGQGSPLAFFARTFSSISSAITSFFCWSLASSRRIFSSWADTLLPALLPSCSKATWALSRRVFC